MTAKVGIVTTLYNYKRYLPELAKSVFDQSYEDWVWVVVDDASTDNPEEVYNKFTDARVYIITLPKNCGYSVAKNVGIRFAVQALDVEYITLIDADDVLTPNSIFDRVAALEENPDKLWLHADALNYGLNGEIENTYIKWIETFRRQFERNGMDFEKDYHHRLIHSQTTMMRREFYEKLGLYDETLRFSSDNEHYRRAIRFGIIPLYLRKVVSIYRAHEKRMSRSEYKKKRILKTKEYIKRIVERRFEEGINSSNTEILC